MIEIGIIGEEKVTVSESNTAITAGSGTLRVFATPAMIALMEKTAWKSVAPYLEEGQGSVGIELNIKHVSATPVGMSVSCRSELIEVDGRKLKFKLQAFDEKGLIGEGLHERFIVDNEKFQSKADSKNQ